LEGGCTAPIGASAVIIDNNLHFKGALFSLDGSQKIEVEKGIAVTNLKDFGKRCAQEILSNGGRELMSEIKKVLK